MITEIQKRKIRKAQRAEITEYYIYRRLAGAMKKGENWTLLEKMAVQEKRHYDYWKTFTGEDLPPIKAKILLYSLMARFFGPSFALRLMEKGEGMAQSFYDELKLVDPGVEKIIKDEERHEEEVLSLIEEEKLEYAGSIVLGLNDTLVELLGALSGFTLALQNTRLVGILGLITGVAASMSMAGSEYLSSREEEDKNAKKASIYTGVAYALTVCVLIAPYFIFTNPFVSLGLAVLFAVLVILGFTFYISVARGISFKSKFRDMVVVSLGVAILSFLIGLVIRKYVNINI